MLEPRSIAKVALKVLLAAVLIGAVFGIAGRNLAPSMPLATWLLWCSAVVGAFLVVSALWAAVNLYLRQWVVRHDPVTKDAVARARALLDPAAFDAAWGAGRALNDEAAYAQSCAWLAGLPA